MNPILLAIVMMLVSGAFMSLQAPINSALGRMLDNGVLAAAISFGTGFAILLAVTLTRTTLPSFSQVAAVPWWGWIGGALGAFYVWAALWSVPRVGVVTVVAALVLGQVIVALVVDRFGLFGLPMQQLSWPRIGAALLVAAGLVLSRF